MHQGGRGKWQAVITALFDVTSWRATAGPIIQFARFLWQALINMGKKEEEWLDFKYPDLRELWRRIVENHQPSGKMLEDPWEQHGSLWKGLVGNGSNLKE